MLPSKINLVLHTKILQQRKTVILLNSSVLIFSALGVNSTIALGQGLQYSSAFLWIIVTSAEFSNFAEITINIL